MSWSAVVWGSLKITPEAEALWREAPADPGAWSDWPREVYVDPDEPVVTVGATLDELLAYDDTTWLRLTRKGDTLEVRGLLHEEQHAEFESQLCAAFRAAAAFGAEGEIVEGDTEMIDFARAVRVGSGTSSIRELTEAECKKLRPIVQTLPDSLQEESPDGDD